MDQFVKTYFYLRKLGLKPANAVALAVSDAAYHSKVAEEARWPFKGTPCLL
jgi:hypothetical protein